MKIKILFAVTWLGALYLGHTQSTGFTYQGRLNNGGAPANGIYDLRFTIYDAVTNGTSFGTLTNSATSVSNGLFTTQLDFGSNVFDGNARWLSIDVRDTAAPSPYVTLSPRQPITAEPYAIHAGTAATFTGQIGDTQLSSNIPRLNSSATFSGSVTFTNASGNFSGNGANINNVNAASLNGLDAQAFWKTSGNSNTTAGTHFVGTTDAQPLEFKVNKARALRIEPNAAGSANIIGGADVNVIDPGVVGSVIAGGGATNFSGNRYTNSIAAPFSFIGSGLQNRINANAGLSMIAAGRNNSIEANSTNSIIGTGEGNTIRSNVQFSVIANGWSNSIAPYAGYAMIGSGFSNTLGLSDIASVIASGWRNNIKDYTTASFIGSGQLNEIASFSDYSVIATGFKNVIEADSQAATISGGAWNHIGEDATYSTISGGLHNSIGTNGVAAIVSGGYSNAAIGFCSFAAGRNAKANHDGTFVWADNQTTSFGSTATNQFLIRASNGVGINTNNPATALHVNGTITATSYLGDGSSLQNLDAAPALQRLSRKITEQTARLDQKDREIQLLRSLNAALEKRLGTIEESLKRRH